MSNQTKVATKAEDQSVATHCSSESSILEVEARVAGRPMCELSPSDLLTLAPRYPDCGEELLRRLESRNAAIRKLNQPLMKLSEEIREVNAANGWNVTQTHEWADTYKVPAILSLIHSEVSEALEAFRHDDGENFVEELADVVIRVLDCVAAFEDDFDAVVRAKIEKNRTRGHKHGGKRV